MALADLGDFLGIGDAGDVDLSAGFEFEDDVAGCTSVFVTFFFGFGAVELFPLRELCFALSKV